MEEQNNVDTQSQVPCWFVMQASFSGIAKPALIWQKEKPGAKTMTGRSTGISFVAHVEPEHRELPLAAIQAIYFKEDKADD